MHQFVIFVNLTHWLVWFLRNFWFFQYLDLHNHPHLHSLIVSTHSSTLDGLIWKTISICCSPKNISRRSLHLFQLSQLTSQQNDYWMDEKHALDQLVLRLSCQVIYWTHPTKSESLQMVYSLFLGKLISFP